MTVFAFRRRPLPAWWVTFTDAHPIVPNVVAIVGLVAILYLLTPGVTHPSGHGEMIDSLSTVVKSGTVVDKAVNLRAAYHHRVPKEVRDYVGKIVFYPALYVVIPFLMALEYLFPCKPSQPLIGKGFLQDAVWFAALTPTTILVLGAASEFLRRFYETYLGFLTIPTTNWPAACQIAAALLVGEFMSWSSHFARHKIESLWLFHAVHHSQQEMNAFTDDRGHVVDRLASSLVMFVPFYMFQVPNLHAVAIIGLYLSIHSRFVHANVKMNLGWLGWIVASPQFHRVHHSVAPEHADKNFGVFLSLFDHLFGTACPSSDIYPETGIRDAHFPLEADLALSQLPGNWLRQTAYPFGQFLVRALPAQLRPWHEPLRDNRLTETQKAYR